MSTLAKPSGSWNADALPLMFQRLDVVLMTIDASSFARGEGHWSAHLGMTDDRVGRRSATSALPATVARIGKDAALELDGRNSTPLYRPSSLAISTACARFRGVVVAPTIS